MSNNKIAGQGTNILAVIIPALIILFPLAYSLFGFVFVHASPDPDPFLEMPDEKYDKCVMDTEYMRFHHMDLLKQVRSEVLREGIRGDIKFDNCKNCHTSKENFCNRCHDKVNLTPDCFGCHYYPESGQGSE